MTGAGVHRFGVRVYYEDTDFSGVVYHASYLRFLERGRSEMLRALGIDQKAMFAAPGVPTSFVVATMRIAWKRPAVMDDMLTVETRLGQLRGASMLLEQTIVRDAAVLLTASVEIAHMAAGRPARMPAAMRAAFAAAAF